MNNKQKASKPDSRDAHREIPTPRLDIDSRGRTGEGAHSAMKEWQERVRKRIDQPDQ